MPAPSLVMQTTYAELLERCATTEFHEEFPEEGAFTSKTIKGRRYWYFQAQAAGGRSQKYVGPETPELMERIGRHRERRSDERERRALVSALVRSFGLPRPVPEIGNIVAALAKAGVFRLRGVLVGTVAYQAYSAMLGVRLSGTTLQTSDIDIAQFLNVSVAIGDRTAPMLDVLKGVDKTFREIPHMSRGRVTSYAAKGGLRVDFLTPNVGPETDTPQRLPALQTHAQPLRFLDFLIHQPEPAALLHAAGVYVRVPAPERYAIHKLIISSRRSAGVAKRDKDLQQAGTLLDALAQKRPIELKLVWQEASKRGPSWRRSLLAGLVRLTPRSRDITLRSVDLTRDELPGINLTFQKSSPARYDPSRDVVTFTGEALGSPVVCAISREALEDHFEADGPEAEGRVEAFLRNRSRIEQLVRTKYLCWPVEEPEAVLVTTMDVKRLSKQGRLRRRS